jgi:hypothetical protein
MAPDFLDVTLSQDLSFALYIYIQHSWIVIPLLDKVTPQNYHYSETDGRRAMSCAVIPFVLVIFSLVISSAI